MFSHNYLIMYSKPCCKYWLTVLVMTLTYKSSLGQNAPCPKIFNTYFDGSEWFGVVDLKDIPPYKPFKLIVEMLLNRNIKNNHLHRGPLDLKIIRNETTEFKVMFSLPPGIPYLSRIMLNGVTLCGVELAGRVVRVLRLEQTPSGEIMFDGIIRDNMPSQYSTTENSKDLMKNNMPNVSGPEDTNCGELQGKFQYYPVDYKVGEFERGTWPWLAAVFDKQGYKCVGTLALGDIVYTSDHCAKQLALNDISVYLGLHNLDELQNDGVIKCSVSAIFVMGRAGVLKLSEKVQFSHFIQPACASERQTNLDDNARITGYYAAWGKDAKGLQSKVPLKGKAQVLSHTLCNLLDANVIVPVDYEKNRTFCIVSDNADVRNSGAGFFERVGSKWMLAAIL